MRSKLLKLIIPTLLLMISCSSKSPTSSTEKETEATAVIGPAGGRLSSSDFVLDVPPGAFSQTVTLNLYSCVEEHPSQAFSVTKLYRLEGLPDNYNDTLKIRIRFQEALDGTSFVAVGGNVLSPASGEEQRVYRLFPAQDSAGFLGISIPADTGYGFNSEGSHRRLKQSQESPLAVYFVGHSGYDPPVVTGHFKIIFPKNLVTHSKLFLPPVLEKAIDSLKALNIDTSLVPFPIEVYIYDFAPADIQRYAMFFPAWGAFSIVFSKQALDEILVYQWVVMAAAARECALAVLCTNDKEYFNVLLQRQVRVNPANYWLHHAVASWFEQKLVPEYPEWHFFKPLDFDLTDHNRQAPFEGLQAGAGNTLLSARNHGGGMSTLIRYLTVNYRESAVFRIYDAIKTQAAPGAAVLGCVADEARVMWPDFLKEYVRGNIYDGPFAGDVYASDVHGAFTIDSAEDTLVDFSLAYPDLSGRIFLMELDYPTLDTIRFVVSSSTIPAEDIAILIFAHKNGSTDPFLIKGETEVILTQVDTLVASGLEQLWVVVVNCHYTEPGYMGTATINLNISITMSRQYLASLWFNIYADLFYNTPTNDSMAWSQYVWPNWEPVTGTMSGNSFSAVWDTVTIWDYPYFGEMTLTFNALRDTILTFYSSATIYQNPWAYRVITISGSSIPLFRSDEGVDIYDIHGLNVCHHISRLDYHWQAEDGSWWEDLVKFNCADSNYINIIVSPAGQ